MINNQPTTTTYNAVKSQNGSSAMELLIKERDVVDTFNPCFKPSLHIGQPSTSTLTCPASFRRRISLPAETAQTPSKNQLILNETLGIVAELLSQKDIPANVVTGIKSIACLLNNLNVRLLSSAATAASANAGDAYSRFQTTIPQTPVAGETVFISPHILSRRTSPVTWSTVTSAIGLPTLEPEPNRSRSSSYWKQKLIDEVVEFEQWAAEKADSVELLIQTNDGTLFDLQLLDNDESYVNIERWSLPIFDLHSASPNTLLSKMAYATFSQSSLFNVFRISRRKFFNFFHCLEKGYWKISYHNIIHASDVLHAIYYFANNPIPALDGRAGGLAEELSALELMALYTAGAMHDYDHPGRTNAFLVAAGDAKAILYNDRSVLENHHAASAWRLLLKQENFFVEHLDAAEYKRFRYIVMEAILATDLKRHFEILMEFDEKINTEGVDWKCEVDRLLIMQICIKMADINSPTKPFDLHSEWTKRIVEEFYSQGDAERALGLPVSAYMDRNEPQVSKLQDSFISHLVKPLATAMQSAGLLSLNRKQSNSSNNLSRSSSSASNSTAGVWATMNKNVEQQGDPKQSLLNENVMDNNNYCSTTASSPSPTYVSELVQNMEDNLDFWKAKFAEETAACLKGSDDLIVEPAVRVNVELVTGNNELMDIIDENDDETKHSNC